MSSAEQVACTHRILKKRPQTVELWKPVHHTAQRRREFTSFDSNILMSL